MPASTRPLTLGEILDRTVQIYRRDFPIFAGISVLPSAIVILVSGAFSIYYSSLLPGVQAAGPNAFKGMLQIFAAFAIFGVVGVPLLLGIYSVTQSSLTFAALGLTERKSVTVRASYGFGFRIFWSSVGVLSLQALFAGVFPSIGFGIILMIFAIAAVAVAAAMGKAVMILAVILYFGVALAFVGVAIWIWLRVSLAFPAKVAEGRKAWDSIKRSNQLSKGTCGRIFVMYLLIAVVTLIVNYALVIPLDLALGLNKQKFVDMIRSGGTLPIFIQIVNLTVGFLVRAFVLPLPAIALALFYNDQRTRKEGYDIELLMANAGWSPLPENPAIAAPLLGRIEVPSDSTETLPDRAEEVPPSPYKAESHSEDPIA